MLVLYKALTVAVAIFLSASPSSSLSCIPRTAVACPRIYDPVCATFHKTFDNPCIMEGQLCRLASEGFHFHQETRKGDCCVGACSYEYDPVCASNNKTYSNNCAMLYGACEERDYLVPAPDTHCPDFPNNCK